MAANLLNCKNLAKSYGARPLFSNLSFSLDQGQRVGVIGPNGAGKSTLLKIFARLEPADSGELTVRRDLRIGYLAQERIFDGALTVERALRDSLKDSDLDEDHRAVQVAKTAGRFGLNLGAGATTLSGGWRKRLAIACELVKEPELLILDEPTNHLDLEGIQFLERLLGSPEITLLVVSHDRTFLENAATRILEVSPRFPDGALCVEGNYSRYLEKREEYLNALSRNEAGLANRVRHEMEWLRRGPKARGTKARARIDEAHRMIEALKEYQSRSRKNRTAEIDFSGSGRKTKRLLAATGLKKAYDDKLLFDGLDFVLAPGVRVGLLGENGTGKSTLLKILAGSVQPDEGEIERAADLRVVHFEQERRTLNPDISLRQTLAPEGDTVFFGGRPLHVASYASRFLFSGEMLSTAVGKLSGGEQARLLIAQLMLQPADVLLLDEPTNDLDIDTLEVLEESLEEFQGSVVLVTHDRLMLDRICNLLIGLDQESGAGLFAEYPQWLDARKVQKKAEAEPRKAPSAGERNEKRKLSYLEKKELGAIEGLIETAEAEAESLQAKLEEPAIAHDAAALNSTYQQLAAARARIEALYQRWAELEALR